MKYTVDWITEIISVYEGYVKESRRKPLITYLESLRGSLREPFDEIRNHAERIVQRQNMLDKFLSVFDENKNCDINSFNKVSDNSSGILESERISKCFHIPEETSHTTLSRSSLTHSNVSHREDGNGENLTSESLEQKHSNANNSFVKDKETEIECETVNGFEQSILTENELDNQKSTEILIDSSPVISLDLQSENEKTLMEQHELISGEYSNPLIVLSIKEKEKEKEVHSIPETRRIKAMIIAYFLLGEFKGEFSSYWKLTRTIVNYVQSLNCPQILSMAYWCMTADFLYSKVLPHWQNHMDESWIRETLIQPLQSREVERSKEFLSNLLLNGPIRKRKFTIQKPFTFAAFRRSPHNEGKSSTDEEAVPVIKTSISNNPPISLDLFIRNGYFRSSRVYQSHSMASISRRTRTLGSNIIFKVFDNMKTQEKYDEEKNMHIKNIKKYNHKLPVLHSTLSTDLLLKHASLKARNIHDTKLREFLITLKDSRDYSRWQCKMEKCEEENREKRIKDWKQSLASNHRLALQTRRVNAEKVRENVKLQKKTLRDAIIASKN